MLSKFSSSNPKLLSSKAVMALFTRYSPLPPPSPLVRSSSPASSTSTAKSLQQAKQIPTKWMEVTCKTFKSQGMAQSTTTINRRLCIRFRPPRNSKSLTFRSRSKWRLRKLSPSKRKNSSNTSFNQRSRREAGFINSNVHLKTIGKSRSHMITRSP